MPLFSASNEIHPLTLHFTGNSRHLEPDYEKEHFKNSLTQVRVALLIGCSFYAVFGILDAVIAPDQKYEFWIIRYAIVCPLAFSIFLFSFSSHFYKHCDLSLFILCTVAGFGIVMMIAMAVPPANYSYYAGLILVFIYLFTFVKMSFLWAFTASWLIIAFYQIVAIYFAKTPFEILLNNNFFIIASNLYCMIAGYSIEYFERRNFVLQRMLSDEKNKVASINAELEKRVRERTKDLEEANLKLRDDAERRMKLESQLRQAQKMEAIGTLAGGVAHDFNNILQVALGYSELILSDTNLTELYRRDVQKIHDAAKRGGDLVQRLLTFSRKTEINAKPLDLNQRIREMLKMVERTIPQMIEVQLFLGEELPAINADPTQIDQILMNLAVNARDAMPDGGKLIFETASVLIDDEHAKAHLAAKPGCYVLLMVTDTGSGMDAETFEHIFEPFYTTKGVGQGTGLGLAMVHGIVKQHGGYIECYSEKSSGTTFKIYLPAIMSEEESRDILSEATPRGGTETILLVDDEESILELGSRILVKAGYTLLKASRGKEALEMYRLRHDEIALVVLDIMMPEMGGKQCLTELLRINPAAKVVIASGYSPIGDTKDALEAGANGYVNKPYDGQQMLKVVRAVLDEK